MSAGDVYCGCTPGGVEMKLVKGLCQGPGTCACGRYKGMWFHPGPDGMLPDPGAAERMLCPRPVLAAGTRKEGEYRTCLNPQTFAAEELGLSEREIPTVDRLRSLAGAYLAFQKEHVKHQDELCARCCEACGTADDLVTEVLKYLEGR